MARIDWTTKKPVKARATASTINPWRNLIRPHRPSRVAKKRWAAAITSAMGDERQVEL